MSSLLVKRSVSTRVKFCGCTSWADVELSIEAGADAVGMIFGPSPRQIAWETARSIATRIPPTVTPVGVFVNPTRDEIDRVRELFPSMLIQLSGEEPEGFVKSLRGQIIKAIHVGADEQHAQLEEACMRYAPALALFDTAAPGMHGGTGETFAWERIAELARWRPVMVAGGLTPHNVGACVRTIRPFAVDVRSGIETDGRKDPAKMRAFVKAVRESDAT